MSPFMFNLYMVWFRIMHIVRSLARTLRRTGNELAPRLFGALRWFRSVLLAPLWISFELYIALWDYLERRNHGKYRLRLWHRSLFCLALSCTVGLAVLLVITGLSVNEGTFLFSGVHGLALFLTWKRGARWLRKMLGARPMRPMNSNNAYEGLDLGN